MNAKEFDTMVKAMRINYNTVNSRTDITDTIYYLYKGLIAIEKNDIAEKLIELYTEIDSIDTEEIVKIGTFA